MKVIHVNDSYKIWSIKIMREVINFFCRDPIMEMDRSYGGMYLEWYLHNIGYYITLPFIFIPKMKELNLRFKDVDLESHCG